MRKISLSKNVEKDAANGFGGDGKNAMKCEKYDLVIEKNSGEYFEVQKTRNIHGLDQVLIFIHRTFRWRPLYDFEIVSHTDKYRYEIRSKLKPIPRARQKKFGMALSD